MHRKIWKGGSIIFVYLLCQVLPVYIMNSGEISASMPTNLVGVFSAVFFFYFVI